MKKIAFNNGDQMPILGLGTYESSSDDGYRAIKEAVRIGYRHIDCAAFYGNEKGIGQALQECFSEGLVSRDQLWITSKLWCNCHAGEDVQPALEKTLSDLQLDYIDLYLMHWPIALKKDIAVPKSAEDMIGLDILPLSETWRAMEEMVGKGLCRHIGVSNFSVLKLKSLLENSRLKPEMNQIELHPYLQQPAMFDFCNAHGIALTGYSPLGAPGRPGHDLSAEPVLIDDPVIAAVAKRRGATPAQVLLSWAIHRGTAVVPKSVSPHRLQQNLAASEVSLTSNDMLEIKSIDRHHRYVPGEFWAKHGGYYTWANLWDE